MYNEIVKALYLYLGWIEKKMSLNNKHKVFYSRIFPQKELNTCFVQMT